MVFLSGGVLGHMSALGNSSCGSESFSGQQEIWQSCLQEVGLDSGGNRCPDGTVGSDFHDLLNAFSLLKLLLQLWHPSCHAVALALIVLESLTCNNYRDK